jgi:hypothetical protein
MFGRLKDFLTRKQKHKTPANIGEFAQLLARSGLTTIQQANDWLTRFRIEQPAESNSPNAISEFCSFLVSGECVTEWQCDKLKLGRWKGFCFEDHYVLLEQVGKGGHDTSTSYSSYKARDN